MSSSPPSFRMLIGRHTCSRPADFSEGEGGRKFSQVTSKEPLAATTLLGISLFAVGVATTNPPDISGNWHGDDWGHVSLTQTAPGEYAGTYTDTVTKEKGPARLLSSRVPHERRQWHPCEQGDDDQAGIFHSASPTKRFAAPQQPTPNRESIPPLPRWPILSGVKPRTALRHVQSCSATESPLAARSTLMAAATNRLRQSAGRPFRRCTRPRCRPGSARQGLPEETAAGRRARRRRGLRPQQ